jgi:hypothetical protein
MTLPTYIAVTQLLAALAAAPSDIDDRDTTVVTEAAPEDAPIDESKLHPVTPISHDSETGAVLIEGVGRVLEQQLGSLDRRRLGQKVLSERRVSIIEGAFGDGVAIVTVNVELRVKDPSEPQSISGVFTLTAAGELGTIVVAPQMRPDNYLITEIGDVDGDGRDDLRLTTKSVSGEDARIVTWNGDVPAAAAADYEEGC